MIILVVVIQSLVFREIAQLFQGIRDPWSKTLNWYFFAVANYYFYGETIIYYLKVCVGLTPACQNSWHYSMCYFPKPFSIRLLRIIDSLALCSICLVCIMLLPVALLMTGRLHGIRRLTQKELPPTTVLTLWMGPHDAIGRRCVLSLYCR